MRKVRLTIRRAARDADETISYQMPTFRLHGNLVSFAAYENHIGFYPGAQGIEEFKEELSVYKSGKGSVRFPLDEPIPLGLIARIVRFRAKKNLEQARRKKR